MSRPFKSVSLFRSYSATYNAGTVGTVKKTVCYLLMMWLALISGVANAHATADVAHAVSHSHDDGLPAPQSQTIDIDAGTTGDSDHADHCNQSHCGHGQISGLVAPYSTSFKIDVLTCAPTSPTSWASSLMTTNIERPKWPVITPAVVSLLS